MKSLIAVAAAVTAVAAVTASTALASSGIARPDDRAVGPRSEPAAAVVSPRAFGHVRPDDRAVGSRSTGESVPAAVPVVVHVASSGFEWGDAGIGAGAGAGLVLVALGGFLVVRQHKTEPRTA
jgi:hypothetical protein